MDLKNLKTEIEVIKNVADDNESAHSREDFLREKVLTEIANGNPEWQEMAKEVLKTSKIKFSRWYA